MKNHPANQKKAFYKKAVRIGLVVFTAALCLIYYRIFYIVSSAASASSSANIRKQEIHHEISNNSSSNDKKQTQFIWIYNIGCDKHSSTETAQWQLLLSNVLDYSFQLVNQAGFLIRLVNGDKCTQEKKMVDEMEIFYYLNTSEKLRTGARYAQVNRPLALLRFLESDEANKFDDSAIFGILDPDFAFRRPIDVRELDAQLGEMEAKGEDAIIGAKYEMGTSFYKTYALKICNDYVKQQQKNPPAIVCTEKQFATYDYNTLEIGAPYFVRKRILKKLLQLWLELIPIGFVYYDSIESDMFSFGIACLLLGIVVHPKPYMKTCMSHELATPEFMAMPLLHVCQTYYLPEWRAEEEYFVTPLEEARRKPAKRGGSDFAYVFNKHWLKQADALSCDERREWYELLPPPGQDLMEKNKERIGVFYSSQMKFAWHSLIVREYVAIINRLLRAYLKKVCGFLMTEEQVRGKKQLILHEQHSGRVGFPNRLNHPVKRAKESG